MGGLGSKEQQKDNPNFDFKKYNELLKSHPGYVTSNTAINPNTAQVDPFQGYGYNLTQKKQSRLSKQPITEQSAKKLMMNFSISKQSIQLIDMNRILNIKFKLNAKTIGQLQAYAMVQEIENKNTFVTQSLISQYVAKKQIYEGQQFVQINILLNTTLKDLGFQRSTTYAFYPLIICLKNNEQKLIIYIKSNKQLKQIIVLKQKIQVGGIGHVFQQIYGVNKAEDEKLCIVCMSEVSNTIIVPCRHMCLCKQCCMQLKNKSDKCPICRRNVQSFTVVNQKS